MEWRGCIRNVGAAAQPDVSTRIATDLVGWPSLSTGEPFWKDIRFMQYLYLEIKILLKQYCAIFSAVIGVLDLIPEGVVLPRFRGECGVCLLARPGHTNV